MTSLFVFTEEPSVLAMSNWIVTDVDTPEGRSLVYDAIKQLVSQLVSQLAITKVTIANSY